MKKILLGVAFAALTSISAYATSACSTFIGQDVTTIGSCTVGPLTFSNFVVTNAGGGSSTPLIDLAGVYGPSAGPEPPAGAYGLNFNPNLGGANSLTDLHFTFQVTGGENSAFLFNGGTTNTQIQERICSGGVTQSGFCTGSQLGSDLVAAGGQTASTI